MTNEEDNLAEYQNNLEYHINNHYYFRDSYIDMQKRCSKLNYKLSKEKHKRLLHCTACLGLGVGVGIILGGFRNENQK